MAAWNFTNTGNYSDTTSSARVLLEAQADSTTAVMETQTSLQNLEGHGVANMSSPQCLMMLGTQVGRAGLGVLAVGFNSMALAAMLRDRRLGRSFRLMLLSLTVADLGVATTVLANSGVALAEVMSPPQSALLRKTVSSFCSLLNGLYHSLLACGATTTLTLSLDRTIAVFAPVRYRANVEWKYRVLVVTAKRTTAAVLPSWILAGLFLVAVPLTGLFQDQQGGTHDFTNFCIPVLDVPREFLIIQALLLLLCTLTVAPVYVVILRRLTRRALLVVPRFGPRTADTTALERKTCLRSVALAASQAFSLCGLYVPYALYLLWMTARGQHRWAEVCEPRFLLSLLPAVNNVVNPLLTLWRIRNFPPCCPAPVTTPVSVAPAVVVLGAAPSSARDLSDTQQVWMAAEEGGTDKSDGKESRDEEEEKPPRTDEEEEPHTDDRAAASLRTERSESEETGSL